jgi:hypothetical protein
MEPNEARARYRAELRTAIDEPNGVDEYRLNNPIDAHVPGRALREVLENRLVHVGPLTVDEVAEHSRFADRWRHFITQRLSDTDIARWLALRFRRQSE